MTSQLLAPTAESAQPCMHANTDATFAQGGRVAYCVNAVVYCILLLLLLYFLASRFPRGEERHAFPAMKLAALLIYVSRLGVLIM